MKKDLFLLEDLELIIDIDFEHSRWVGLVLRFITIYNTCMLLTLSMGVGLKLPPYINPKCG